MPSGRLIWGNLCLTIALQIVSIENAFAYLDPGAGSLIFQAVVAGIITGLFALKVFFQKIKDYLKRLFRQNSQE